MIRRPPRSTHCISSAASDVYKRQGIKHALIYYLQHTTDFLKCCDVAAPAIKCRILQIDPSLKLCDRETSVEADVTSSLKFVIRDYKDKWVSIEDYNFARRAGGRYVLVFEELRELSRADELETAPADCMEDESVKKYAEMHRRAGEREKLEMLADDLPSFDALAMGTSERLPVCLRPRNFGQSEESESYVRTGKADIDGFLDISLDVLESNRRVMNDKLKIPLKCNREVLELEVEEITESTHIEPEEDRRNYASYGLGHLVSGVTPEKSAAALVTQGAVAGSTSKEIPASEEYAEKINRTLGRAIGIEDTPSTARTVKHVAKRINKSSIKEEEVKSKAVTEVKEEKELVKPIEISPGEFNRYLSWRNFHKQARVVNRKLEFSKEDLAASDSIEFTIEAKNEVDSPLIQSEHKRRKPN
eukprot:TRINITY_DN10910_c0_g1_i10.p1 TRINITY_DN10910_c0_g1~~TRINITY_DN10910_c0_g1_i10.p1  ORF type:complete len:425 (-),score=111.68 TRINITY_DN10910_c0_g1_i10:122-1375(-)